MPKKLRQEKKNGRGGTSGPEVSRRREMRHDGLTKEPADIINADQSAATFIPANNARSSDLNPGAGNKRQGAAL